MTKRRELDMRWAVTEGSNFGPDHHLVDSLNVYRQLDPVVQMSKNLHTAITPKSIVLDFLSGIGYSRETQSDLTTSQHTLQRLEQDITREIESWNLPKDSSEDNKYMHKILRALIRPSGAMGAMAYPDHDYPVQLLIAKLTLFVLYVDDKSSFPKCSSPSSLQPFLEFQHRFTHSSPQSHMEPVLEHFAGALRDIYKYWDTVSANASVTAILEFMNGCCIENLTEGAQGDTEGGGNLDKEDKKQGQIDRGDGAKRVIGGMKINTNALDYPDFLRSKTGATQAFAFFVFARSQSLSSSASSGYPNLKGFIQAIPSMTKWANLTNDILSFHKEELAGETANFVHLKAKVTRLGTENGTEGVNAGNPPSHVLQVARKLVEDALTTAERIDSILSGEYLHAWLAFKVRCPSIYHSPRLFRTESMVIN